MAINFPPSYYAPEYLQIHRRALKNTIYGAGNVIKTEISSGKIVYVMNSTGKVYSRAEDAFDAASVSGLTGFARVTGGGPGQSGSMRGLGGFNERARSIKEMLKNDTALRDSLSFINSATDDLSFTIGSARIPQDAKEVAKNVLRDVSKGKGFMFQTKDSGTFVRAFVNGKELSDVQLNELLYKTSNGAGGLFSNEQIAKSLASGELGKLFTKAAKRGKGIFSLDGVSLAGNDLLSLAKGLDSRNSTFGDSVKIFDTSSDLTKIALEHLEDPTLTGEALVRRAMAKAGLSSDEIEEAAAYYGRSGALESALNSMESLGIISTKNAGIAELTNAYPEIQDVLKGLKSKDDLVGPAAVRYEELMEQFQRPYDGSTLINKNFINKMRSNMQAELTALEAKGLANLSPEEFEKMKFLKSDIDNSASGMDAETIRFNFMRNGEALNIKGVGTTAELDPRLARYSTVTSKANIKRELSIMGQTDMANIILQGEGRNLVFEDPLAPAFHGEIFSSQEAIDSTAARGNRILASYQEALKTGNFDENLTKEIYRQSQQSIEALPIEFRTTAERSKRFATSLVSALESGTDIRQIPQLSNYLMNFVQSQIAREKSGILQPIMENVYRFSIDSELAYYSGRSVGLDKATLKDATNLRLSSEAGANEIGLMNFKIRGHKMLTSGNAANIFHHSLGTFDLDDKGIPMMRAMDIFNEKGESIGERIGFFTFRQPTGPGEYVLSMAEFDTETIRATFGANQSYVSTLNQIVADGTASLDQQLLHKIVSPESMTEKQMRSLDILHAPMFRDQASIHETMIQTMRQSKTPIVKITQDIINDLKNEKYGSTLSMNKDRYDSLVRAGFEESQLTANYRQGNIYKLFAESGTYDFEQSSIDEILKSSLFSSSEKSEIQRLSKIKGRGTELQQMLGQITKSGSADLVAQKELFTSNLITREFGIKQLRAAESADSLGLYINRLTMVSASTRQSEQILGQLNAADVLKLKQNYKVGLIDPGQAIDYAINMNNGASIKLASSTGPGTAEHYTEEVYNSLTASIRRSAESGADMRGVQLSLAKLTGKLAGDDTAGILSQVGAQAVEEQGRYIGALRALAYKQGIEDPDFLAGVDEKILRQRLKEGDNAAYLRGMLAGYRDFSSEIDSSNQLAKAFITSLENAGKTNQDINDTLVRLIGIKSGKYAAISEMNRNAARATAGVKAAAQTFGVDRNKPFMGEAVLTGEGRQAASQVLNLQEKMSKELEDMFSGAINGAEDMAELSKLRNSIESQMMGQKIYESILDSANKTNSSIQEVIDSIDTMSPMRRGLKDLALLSTGGEDANELMKLVQGARDNRAMAYYKRQSGLMDLADQYDAIKSSPKFQAKLDAYNTLNVYRRAYGVDPEINPIMEAMNVGSGRQIKDLGLSDELASQVRDIREVSRIRGNLTPELQDLLSKRGSAIDLAPTVLEDADRITMLGDEGVDVSDNLAKRNYKRIGDSFRDGAMKKAFENPTIRKAGYAGLAIIAASFAFQHSKGRTPEDVSGPPLLPGGSSYEQMPQRSPQMPQTSMFSGYNQGTSYSVNIEGSSDQINSFRSAAGSVAPGSVNSTMYKGLPNLGSDPYSQVASSF